MDQFLSGTNDSYVNMINDSYVYISDETKKIGKKELYHQLSFQSKIHLYPPLIYIGYVFVRAGRCQVYNGGCSQLCYLSGDSDNTCGCAIGFKLNADGRSCDSGTVIPLIPDDALRHHPVNSAG